MKFKDHNNKEISFTLVDGGMVVSINNNNSIQQATLSIPQIKELAQSLQKLLNPSKEDKCTCCN